jgi:hypothetical protein
MQNKAGDYIKAISPVKVDSPASDCHADAASGFCYEEE